MSDHRRTSAHALLLMALGLSVIYHAGPWPWMTRALTLAGALAPALFLAGHMQDGKRDDGPAVTALLIATMFLSTFLIQLRPGADPTRVYVNYAFANVIAQCLLAGVWAAWARHARGEVVALVGTVLASVGAAMAAYGHLYKGLWLGKAHPVPPPWAEWRSGEHGAVDAFTRMATEMIPPEAFMLSLALAIWLLVVVRPWLRDRF